MILFWTEDCLRPYSEFFALFLSCWTAWYWINRQYLFREKEKEKHPKHDKHKPVTQEKEKHPKHDKHKPVTQIQKEDWRKRGIF